MDCGDLVDHPVHRQVPVHCQEDGVQAVRDGPYQFSEPGSFEGVAHETARGLVVWRPPFLELGVRSLHAVCDLVLLWVSFGPFAFHLGVGNGLTGPDG